MAKTCWKADDGKTHLITEDGKMTRCGRSLVIIPGQLVEAESYSCKGCRAAKEQAQVMPSDITSTRSRRSTSFPMPFGKHRGRPVYDLDDGYLEWLRDNVDLYGPLRMAVFDELEERGIGSETDDDEYETDQRGWSG